MSYASVAEFRSWFEGAGKRVTQYIQETDTAVQNTRLQQALDAASSVMDGHFSLARYETPVDYLDAGVHADAVRAQLVMACVDLAVDNLRPGTAAIPEGMVEGKNKSMTWLESLHRPVGHDGFGLPVLAASIPGLPRNGGALGANTLSTRVVAQTAHGFAGSEFVGLDGSGDWQLAQADGIAPLAAGFVLRVFDADSFEAVLTVGVAFYRAAHGLGATGATLYLSQVAAGESVTAAPGSGIVQRLGRVLDANNLLLDAVEL